MDMVTRTSSTAEEDTRPTVSPTPSLQRRSHNARSAGIRRAGVTPWSRLPAVARRAILLLLLLGFWQLYVSMSNVSSLLFPTPIDVLRALWDGYATGSMLSATLVTLRLLGIGILVGLGLAILLTTLATWTQIGRDLLDLLVAILNPLPSIAVLPLAMLWFGLTPTSLVFVVANSVVWPMAVNISTGFRTVNPSIMMVSASIGLRGWRLVRDVLLPSALPHAITGVRTGIAFGWRTIVAAELVFGASGGRGGLGYYINEAKYFLRIPAVFAGLVTIAAIGIILETIFLLIENRTVVRWGMKTK